MPRTAGGGRQALGDGRLASASGSVVLGVPALSRICDARLYDPLEPLELIPLMNRSRQAGNREQLFKANAQPSNAMTLVSAMLKLRSPLTIKTHQAERACMTRVPPPSGRPHHAEEVPTVHPALDQLLARVGGVRRLDRFAV